MIGNPRKHAAVWTSLAIALIALIAGSCSPKRDQAYGRATAKQQADEFVTALVTERYDFVVSRVPVYITKGMGGSKKATESIRAEFEKQRSAGIHMRACTLGEPGVLAGKDGLTFVIIPIKIEWVISNGNLLFSNSYLLGISDERCRHWTFLDGAGIEKVRDQVQADLPSEIVLPEYVPATFVDDVGSSSAAK